MKKLISILLLILVSCSTDNSGNSVVPEHPTNLTGNVATTTQINLSWTDNSANETGFKIERKTTIGTYTIVGTVNAGILTFNDTGLTPSTTYIYRVFSYNDIGNSPNYSNELTLTTGTLLPTVATTAESIISTTTASSGGTISNEGAGAIIARGVVWSTDPNPIVTLTTKTTDGTGTGVFTSSITGLTANTAYYVRAYATNSAGTAYGNQVSFTTTDAVTDIDGNVYSTVIICNQTWTQTNLNVSKYRNGDVIPQVTDITQWATLTTGAWCYYENTTSNGSVYGKLYNWYAVNDTRGLAPVGYHIPTDAELNTLRDCLGEIEVGGGKMKEAGTTHWGSPNTGATNSSGFTGLPGGRLNPEGSAGGMGIIGAWWGATPAEAAPYASYYGMQFNYEDLLMNYHPVNYGLSVRCIRD